MKEINILSGTKDAILENKKNAMRILISPQPEKKEYSTKLTNMEDGRVGALFTDVHTHPVDGQAVFPDAKAGDIMFFHHNGDTHYIQVTSVHPERIGDMTEDKAIEEGFEPNEHVSALEKFYALWTMTFPGTIIDNPWVWVVKFQKIKITRE